jgi:hypothetical protein
VISCFLLRSTDESGWKKRCRNDEELVEACGKIAEVEVEAAEAAAGLFSSEAAEETRAAAAFDAEVKLDGILIACIAAGSSVKLVLASSFSLLLL